MRDREIFAEEVSQRSSVAATKIRGRNVVSSFTNTISYAHKREFLGDPKVKDCDSVTATPEMANHAEIGSSGKRRFEPESFKRISE